MGNLAALRPTYQLVCLKTFRSNLGEKSLKNIFLNIFMFNPIKKKEKAPNRKCRGAVDIAYKPLVLYLWLPEVERMFAQIVMDCQTQKETVSCGYCIVKENCHLRLELGNKTRPLEMEESSSSMLVPLLLVRV